MPSNCTDRDPMVLSTSGTSLNAYCTVALPASSSGQVTAPACMCDSTDDLQSSEKVLPSTLAVSEKSHPHPSATQSVKWLHNGLERFKSGSACVEHCSRDLLTVDPERFYSVSATYARYVCPEGHSVNLTCTITGSATETHDHLIPLWYFSKNRNPSCSQRRHEHNGTSKELHARHGVHLQHTRTLLLHLKNLTYTDSGDYCCFLITTINKHPRHEAHGHMQLEVKSDDPNLQACKLYVSSGEDDSGTAAALAIVSCIIGILCMPLILFLVYRQRKAISNRRAQELVRMDSEAQGIENPVFDDPPSSNIVGATEQRPRLIFMASRQQSESDRHLLSEPNTPLSPPGPNEVFFPSLEPVPDSPDPVNF
ncbi:V-type immunoglobulin domain-containing suppressor of T-cell activation [Pelodytes ibericus]